METSLGIATGIGIFLLTIGVIIFIVCFLYSFGVIDWPADATIRPPKLVEIGFVCVICGLILIVAANVPNNAPNIKKETNVEIQTTNSEIIQY